MNEKESIDKIIKIMEEELKHPKDFFLSFNIINYSNDNNYVRSVNVGPLSNRKRNEMFYSLFSELLFPEENIKDALESFLKFSKAVAEKKVLRLIKEVEEGDCLCPESKKS